MWMGGGEGGRVWHWSKTKACASVDGWRSGRRGRRGSASARADEDRPGLAGRARGQGICGRRVACEERFLIPSIVSTTFINGTQGCY